MWTCAKWARGLKCAVACPWLPSVHASRLTLRRAAPAVYQLIQGTVDEEDTADKEWVYRPYLNTARKRVYL
jgi:hypothetical protein